LKEALIRFGKKLVILGAVVLVMAAALVLPSKLMENDVAQDDTQFGDDPSLYRGGSYCDGGATLLSWSLEEALKLGCEFESNDYFDYIVPPETFHPNLKTIKADALSESGNVFIILPLGVTTIEDRAMSSGTICCIPETAKNISRGAFSVFHEDPVYEAPSSMVIRFGGRPISETYDIPRWYELYGIQCDSWKVFNGFVYRFGKKAIDPNYPYPRTLFNTQEIDGVTYHFAKTGELLSAELPEGEYDLDGIKILVDGEGNVTLKE